MSPLTPLLSEESTREPIAIVGLGCRYAGIADPESLWTILVNGVETVCEYPGGRTPDLDRFYAQAGKPGGAITSRGGFIPDLAEFDAQFFGISPREAVYIDPQQRLTLEAAYQAFEDAGYTRSQLKGTPTSVFLGLWNNDYQALTNAFAKHQLFTLTGGSTFGGASRLCYFFDLQGSEFAVNAGCASSLISVHLACQALRARDCSLALAGGANAVLCKDASLSFSEAGTLSRDGRCKFGDVRADGFVRSEGAGIVVLKRLSDAERDGDRVRAVILGTAVNSDGHSEGLWVRPSQAGQEQALAQALRLSNLTGAEIDYVEAHGTGTSSGDPIELNAISSVIGRAPGRTRACLVGSVKTNIGHPESAAGIAGLLKTVLALNHSYIPRTLHVDELTPALDWKSSGIGLAVEGAPWPATQKVRRAVVSSFGLTGTNSDVVVSEAPKALKVADQRTVPSWGGLFLLPVTAQSPEALKTLCDEFAARVELAEAEELPDICYTAARRRNFLAWRVAAIGRTGQELAADLRRLAEQTGGPGSLAEMEPGDVAPIVFVFPGQGSQWIGMGRQLYAQSDAFREVIDQCEAFIAAEAGWSLIAHLLDPELAARWELIDVIQPALFAIEVALTAVWRAWGIEPAAVVGHSMGETAAAYVAGALSLSDAIAVICRRSRILLRARGQGAMAVVEATLSESEQAINGYHDRLSVAVSNSSRSTVLSGDPDALTSVLEKLEQQGVFCRRIKVDVASHSPQMDALTSDLLTSLKDVQPRIATVPFYSTVTGDRIEGAACDARYWVRNLRQPVLFSSATNRLLRDGHSTFIEMSPHPILVPSVQQTFADAARPGLALASLRREEEEAGTLFASLSSLFAAGHSLRWEALYPSGNVVSLPRHIWLRKRHWVEGVEQGIARAADPLAHPLLQSEHASADGRSTWTASLGVSRFPWLSDHAVRETVLLPASAYVEMADAAGRALFGEQPFQVEDLSFTDALILPAEGSALIQLVATPRTGQRYDLRFYRSGDEDSARWRAFASGTLRKAAAVEPESENGPSAAENGSIAISAETHFKQMERFGYRFGPAFHSLAGYSIGRESAQGEIHLPPGIEADGYALHPVLLDAAFQVAGALLLQKHKPFGPLLPVHLSSFRLLSTPSSGAKLKATAQLLTSDEFAANVIIRQDDDSVIALIEALRFAPLEKQSGLEVDRFLYHLDWTEAAPLERVLPTAGNTPESGLWLLVGEGDGLGDRLALQLKALGHAVERLPAGRAQPLPTFVSQRPLRGLIYLGALDRVEDRSLDAVELQLGEVTHWLQQIDSALGAGSIVFVTRGGVKAQAADAVNRAQAPLWGLAAALAKERPQTPFICIDLAPSTNDLAVELLLSREETRIAVRPGKRYAGRLRAGRPSSEGSPRLKRALAPDERFEVHIQAKGVLDSLELRAHPRRLPEAHEVEIEVVASALNFIDVASAMGLEQVTRDALGLECAGRVVRVGAAVTNFAIGQEVVAVTPSYQDFGLLTSYTTLPADLVWPKPASLTLAEAASFPSVYMTAYYGLVELARLEAGERVLIHSAAGGVGLAAIEIAKSRGAEIFATAGSDAKRAYLRQLGIQHVMDSRSLAFGDEIQKNTGGRGVDVVLNSLTGAAIEVGLNSLAHYGRFVEIGKLDIFENTTVGLQPFGRNLSFFALDLGRFFTERRDVLARMMRELSAQFDQKRLAPLPVTAFPATEAAAAFHYLAAAKHIGKVVLEMQAGAASVTGPAIRVRPEASYLVTGGLGALGLTAAAELVNRGARHLVLTGRREPSEEAAERINALRDAGVSVEVVSCDVSNEADVRRVLGRYQTASQPLRGIVHAAGVLDDALLENLTPAHFASVFGGKARGAALLDRLTDSVELDFFILFSSVAAVLGSIGQANYAAANAYLDALAHERVGRAKPCTSINWGPWAEIGLAAAQSNRGDRLASQGLPSITPKEGQRLFGDSLDALPTQIIATRFDPSLWHESFPSVGEAQFLSLLTASAATQAAAVVSPVLEQLRSAPPEGVAALLTTHVREQLAAVLRLPAAEVPLKRAFRTYGLDSLMGLELRNRLERSLGVKLPATVIWNYSSVEALAGHLVTRLNVSAATPQPAAAPHVVQPAVPADVPAGAPADAAALLAAELAAAESLLQNL